ncbi:hypothetical protein NLX86_22725 [Streptomyces sp. A3M-1-3]|uniref:hypothetical protein n=1 Tax=Streptomyces sp. A3M-1-3 TaxID=2962044 RepID=UPI0020B68C90|nr:hypothetical protein [Streptomyces sp. A3M-1-3]MCP3820807.1 hypothetical protein [Streptomyces sp. A3M-1-3]
MTAFPPAARIRRAALVGAVCAGLAAASSGCGEDPDAGTNGVGKLSAEKIENRAQQAVDGADAVRLSGTVISKGRTYKLDMRLKGDGGTGVVTSKDVTFQLLRVGEQLFLKADAAFWSHDSDDEAKPSPSDSTAADKLDDKYVKVPEGDPAYKQLRGFTEMNILLDGLLGLHGKLEKGDRSKVGGTRTIQVTADKGAGGKLEVSLQGAPFPLRMERAGGAGVVELADWNEEFALSAPGKDETVDYGRQLPTGD